METSQASQTSPQESNTQHTAANVLAQINARFLMEINEANELLEWAVSSGKDIPKEIVSKIKNGQALISSQDVNPIDRTEFEFAYSQLANLLAPVTFKTLKATSDLYGKESCLAPIHFAINNFNRFRTWINSLFSHPSTNKKETPTSLTTTHQTYKSQGKLCETWKPVYISRARVWSRMLWIWTLIFFILILFGEHLQEYLNQFTNSDAPSDNTDNTKIANSTEWARLSFWLKTITPFCYGALGASAFLLRSCHKHIHERTFDPRRLPEYYNRILLGLLSGGTILLYLNPDQNPAKIGAAGLAFLAGYSTDFFFTYIERIIDALTPKSPISSSILASSSLTPSSSTTTTPPPSTTAPPPPPGHT